MDVWFLVVQGELVLPRLARVEAVQGSGRTRLVTDGALAPEWRASVENALASARALAAAPRADLVVAVPGTTRHEGASAGLPIGLAAAAALRGLEACRFFATGGVADAEGRLVGGLGAHAKAEAVAALAVANGWSGPPLFLMPAGVARPAVAGVSVVQSSRLADAYASLEAATRSPRASISSRTARTSRAISSHGTSG